MRDIKLAGCKMHQNKKCELYCKNCKTSICSKCVASNNHSNHIFEEISVICDKLKSRLRKENQEYQRYITPTYDKIISNLQSSLDTQKISYKKLREDVEKQRQRLHSEVDRSIQTLLHSADVMENGDMTVLSRSLSEMQNRRSDIQLAIKENQKLESDYDAASLMEYSSKMSEYLRIPSLTEVTTPSFIPKEVKSDVLANMCGTLIPSTKTKRESDLIEILKEEAGEGQ
ncbi:E3 ubiquitin-protein ligase TRIM36-like [Saccostrea echinata]|uniref:E3 ubiquitin-protein ligase TRIM36-like n=1 Tax=Saccostrea echinata TaxID=191078 RepID=UPI002A8295D4|nr:E3 ubiquitin-protein ligase TRIM36-like [Saccostrea echinata]